MRREEKKRKGEREENGALKGFDQKEEEGIGLHVEALARLLFCLLHFADQLLVHSMSLLGPRVEETLNLVNKREGGDNGGV